MAALPAPNARHMQLARFRKGKRCVPGTYMSAAGIQTELTPSCLHKVAVHEAVYRRHVNTYRQDLEQQVDKLNRGQNTLKKSLKFYRQKKRENKRKRYDSQPQLTSASDDSFYNSKQLVVFVDEDGKVSKSKHMKRKRSSQGTTSSLDVTEDVTTLTSSATAWKT